MFTIDGRARKAPLAAALPAGFVEALPDETATTAGRMMMALIRNHGEIHAGSSYEPDAARGRATELAACNTLAKASP